MMQDTFLLHQAKRTNGVIEKGIVVKNTYEAAKQSYHAYLGAYAYGQSATTDWVSCMITDKAGFVLMNEAWEAQE